MAGFGCPPRVAEIGNQQTVLTGAPRWSLIVALEKLSRIKVPQTQIEVAC